MSIKWRNGDDLSKVDWPFFGYAPGKYMGSCKKCQEQVVNVDKYAVRCLSCAIIDAKEHFAKVTVFSRENAQQLEAIKNGFTALKGLFDGPDVAT